MTQSPPPGRAHAHLDDALEAAIAGMFASPDGGADAPAGTAPDRRTNGRPQDGPRDPSAQASAEARSLLPIAAALHAAPALDPTRRAALGALLERIAGEPVAEPAPPDPAAAPVAPVAPPVPAADAVPAPSRNGARPAGTLTIVGVLALLAAGGALWRGIGATVRPNAGDSSTAAPAAGAPGARPGGAAASPADDAAAGAGSAPASNDAGSGDPLDATRTAPAVSRLGMPSLGYEAAAAASATRSAVRAKATTSGTGSAGPAGASAGASAGVGIGAAPLGSPTAVDAAPPPDEPVQAPKATSGRRHTSTAVPTPTQSASPPSVPSHPCAVLAQPNVLVARIVADDGAPIADAVVTLFLVGQVDFASVGATDGNGCVAIEQAPGRYELRAEAAGHDVRWFPDAVDRSAALPLEVDGAAARPPVDVRLPRTVATPLPSASASPPPPSATPTAALPPAVESPTAGPPATADVAPPPDTAGGPDGWPNESIAVDPPAAERIAGRPAAAAAAWDAAERPDVDRLDTVGGGAPDAASAAAALPADRQLELDGLAEFAQDGGTVTAVAIDGALVWGVVGPRVVAWPRGGAGGGSAAPVAWTPVLPEVPEAIAIDGARLVVATPGRDGAPATVWLFDIAAAGGRGRPEGDRAPATVPALGACDLTRSGAATVTSMAADDTWIHVLTERGLAIVDAKRAAAPFEIGDAAAGVAPSARAAGSLALLGGGTHVLIARPSGLQVVDVRAPANPRVVFQGVTRDVHAVAAVRTVGPDGAETELAIAIEAVAGRLAGSGGILRLTTLDVTDPTRPRALAAVSLPDGVAPVTDGARAVTAVAGAQAAVVDGDGRSLWLIDLTAPATPVVSQRLPLAPAPTGAAALAMDGDGTAAVALGAAGIRLLRDGIETPGDVVPPVAQLALGVDGRIGWGAAGAAGVVAVDLAAGDTAATGRMLLASAAARAPDGSAADVHSVLSHGDTVYALTRRGGLIVFDGTDPRRPRQLDVADSRLAAMDGGAETVQMAADGLRLYVPDGAGAVHIVDVRDPGQPSESGRWAGIGGGDGDLVALAAAGARLYALTSDGRTSRLRAFDAGDLSAPRQVGAPLDLGLAYRHIDLTADRLILSGDRRSPGLGAVDRGLDPSTLVEVPGLAAGAVGLIDLPGGVRRALVADDAYLTALDLDALADADRRVSGRSVRLPLGRRVAGGTTDVRIVGDRVFVARREAGLFARPHGGFALPAAPAAVPPGSGAPVVMTHRIFLPSLANGQPPCDAADRLHGVMLVDAALASFVEAGAAPGQDGAGGLARLRPAVAAWLDGLGVGQRPGTGASIVLWGEQANFVGQGADPGALATAFPGRVVPRPGRRVDLALRSAEQQLAARAGPATVDEVGRVVLVAAEGWPADTQAKAEADAARLRAAGWRIEAVALGDRAPLRQLAALTGDATGVVRVATVAELPAALAAAGRAAWLCPR